MVAPGCRFCPAGTWSKGGATSKAQCTEDVPAGHYNGGKTIGVCPAGTWSKTGAINKAQCKEQVPAGSYNDGTTVDACPAGTWSKVGSTSVVQCTVINGQNKGRSAGYLAPGDTHATPCPSGSTGPPGATSWTQCTVGSGEDKGRSLAFLPRGEESWNGINLPHTWRQILAAKTPVACPPNATSPVGATALEQCECTAGFFHGHKFGLFTEWCILCPAGYVTGKLSATAKLRDRGAVSCTPCAAGHTSPKSTVPCVLCGPGNVTDTLDGDAASTCTSCADLGKYDDDLSSSSPCRTCPEHSTLDTSKPPATKCVDDPSGWYSTSSRYIYAFGSNRATGGKGFTCPAGYFPIQTDDHCSNAVKQLQVRDTTVSSLRSSRYPPGCYVTSAKPQLTGSVLFVANGNVNYHFSSYQHYTALCQKGEAQYSCDDFVSNKWCTASGGYGGGWQSKWQSFARRASTDGTIATQACCGCGKDPG